MRLLILLLLISCSSEPLITTELEDMQIHVEFERPTSIGFVYSNSTSTIDRKYYNVTTIHVKYKTVVDSVYSKVYTYHINETTGCDSNESRLTIDTPSGWNDIIYGSNTCIVGNK